MHVEIPKGSIVFPSLYLRTVKAVLRQKLQQSRYCVQFRCWSNLLHKGNYVALNTSLMDIFNQAINSLEIKLVNDVYYIYINPVIKPVQSEYTLDFLIRLITHGNSDIPSFPVFFNELYQITNKGR